MLSQTAEYALRAAIGLARRAGSGPVPVDELARELDLPRNYLSKILHSLARAGIVASVRGPGGGYRLVKPPSATTLLSVVETFDDLSPRRKCILGREVCSDAAACPVHRRWRTAAEEIAGFFRHTTLADVAD